ncbi:MAG: FtsX-like permease family protein [Bacilli bacterium]|nr:FtsX-like permease family protein [Bacilli bacterium]
MYILNMINIRERKYEIGVLRTIGMSKVKLTMQFISELMIVTLIALLLGLGIGAISAKEVSNSLLQREITRTNKSEKEVQENFGGKMPDGDKNSSKSQSNFSKNGPNISAYQSIDAVVDIKVILELLAISLGLVLVSSLASMISIQHFSPLTILKERS